jgi:hypothetical protein
MTELTLDGHLGTSLSIDLCTVCQAFWFDARESLQLTPGATLRLFREIGDRRSDAKAAAALEGHCPRCTMRLKPVHDMQRTTRFQYLRCPAGHGRLISFVDFLREKNFLTPLSADQLEALRRNVQTVNCSNCAAPIDLAKSSICTHCGSPLSMIDFRQAQALIDQLRDADAGEVNVDPAS